MEHQHSTSGHLFALMTVLLWGTTFISTKILLVDFTPVEILFFRFIMGLIALMLIYPRRMPKTTARQEMLFALAGLSGICLYYLLENIALTCTLASNVGVVVAVSPFFTAILSRLLNKDEERPRLSFLIGFLLAFGGICLISFNGSQLQLNPLGDLLAILAAVAWAFYSILTRKISRFGFHTIQTTRRVFAYGIVFMLPALFFFDFEWNFARFSDPVALFNIIFLGLGASALCFVTWGVAVRRLGTVKTSVYIYLVPVITMVTSVLILHENITPMAAMGAALTLAGLVVSEGKWTMKLPQKA